MNIISINLINLNKKHGGIMDLIQEHLSYFKKHFPEVYEAYQEYGRKIHTESGPLDEKTRWLIKVSISATQGYSYALKTHIKKAINAGCNREEIQQAILLIAPSVGFPKMMEALLIYRDVFGE